MTTNVSYLRNGPNASYRKCSVAIGNPHMFNKSSYAIYMCVMPLFTDHMSLYRVAGH